MDPRRLLPALAGVTAVLVLVTVVAVGWRTWSDGETSRSTVPTTASREAPPAQRTSSGSTAAAVLADWDARRARAWARGDARALSRLYVEGSRAGESDVSLLRRYARRGLRVSGLQTQVLDLDVVDEEPRRLHLVVTDRVVGGEAVGDGRSVALPRDLPSTRRVVLVRVAGRWLVDRVVDEPAASGQPRAAASTSRTSRSSKS